MKKILLALSAACLTVFTGCKIFEGDPSQLAYLSGAAAGKAVCMASLKPAAHNRVIEVVQIVRDVVPGTNQTFAAVWGAAAKTYVNELADAGKVDKDLVPVIVGGVETAGIAIDYLFSKHPDWKANTETVEIVVDQFTIGFLTTCVPVDEKLGGAIKMPANTKIDQDTFNYLKACGRF